MTISFKHEYRRPNLTSLCNVIGDVIIMKNILIWDNLWRSFHSWCQDGSIRNILEFSMFLLFVRPAQWQVTQLSSTTHSARSCLSVTDSRERLRSLIHSEAWETWTTSLTFQPINHYEGLLRNRSAMSSVSQLHWTLSLWEDEHSSNKSTRLPTNWSLSNMPWCWSCCGQDCSPVNGVVAHDLVNIWRQIICILYDGANPPVHIKNTQTRCFSIPPPPFFF